MNKFIRRMSLTLALMQILSLGKFSLDKNSNLYSTITQITNMEALGERELRKKNNNKYLRYDATTDTYSNVSIFDDENVISRQYGANQMDFRYHFKQLIKDPLFLKELKKYFPTKLFNSEEEAAYFYEKYCDIICKCGCGYAAATNYVFRLYEGREEEFKKTFGYSMYTVNEKNQIDFNYELFMLSFFNYSVIKMGEYKEDILNSMNKDFCNIRLQKYLKSEEYNRKKPDNYTEWTEKEWDKWHKFEEERDKKYHELYDAWQNAQNTYLSFPIILDACFGHLYSYLINHRQKSIKVTCEYDTKISDLTVDNIIASENYILYKLNTYGYKCDMQIVSTPHYVYITDINEDGTIIVSSWGDRYYFNYNNISWLTKVLIKTGKK